MKQLYPLFVTALNLLYGRLLLRRKPKVGNGKAAVLETRTPLLAPVPSLVYALGLHRVAQKPVGRLPCKTLIAQDDFVEGIKVPAGNGLHQLLVTGFLIHLFQSSTAGLQCHFAECGEELYF